MNKVLILDDDKFFAEDLSMLLDLEGIKSIVINSADQMYEMVQTLHDCDAVFLDIMLRSGSHYSVQACEETGEVIYKQLRSLYPDKIIVVTSAKNIGEIDILVDEVKTFFIGKPLDGNISDILSIVTQCG
ncbi:hypothetical protein ACMXYX_14095 [Neptuniibacter sp. QD72_48]|uniref:hypothetical protein n=1 Tax=Neptuniibacter sp. QD72_48 TaxID=3398214 RepID=UPI0039F505DC